MDYYRRKGEKRERIKKEKDLLEGLKSLPCEGRKSVLRRLERYEDGSMDSDTDQDSEPEY